ncbi:MAG TPA: LysM peptidoglycan-binding domain-containing protein [Kiritimatiellia bacterium]|nr:LysM peptidoglycan-binding domain-containing protein [Kiritimatiellia bacterium]HMP34884.1 LysM peptidoglycan-binding domain-containing protein [Kiritimatiellia bacterium]
MIRNVRYALFARSIVALFALALVAGCGGQDRDPNIKRARERRAVGDYPGALEWYQRALDKKPGVARVHWDMAQIYDQHLTNELRAIYHYERYLELDPKAERRQLVEQSIGLAKLSYAVSLPDRPSEAVQEIARLRREIDSLRALLTEARDEMARLSAAQVARSAVPAPGAATPAAVGVSPTTPVAIEPLKPAPPQPTRFDTYIVQPGDTMSKIAKKMYNDANKWELIFQANKASLRRPQDIKVGQTLMIPR